MKRLDQGLLHPETNMSRPGIEPGAPGEHSSKELFEQLMLLLFETSKVLKTLYVLWVKFRSKLWTLRRVKYHPSFISRYLDIASLRSAHMQVARTRIKLIRKVNIP
jgi:hypothetical protein